MTKKIPPGCPRCGGRVRPVAGLLTCEKCGHRLQSNISFDRRHDVPRLGGIMKKPLLDDQS